MEVSSELRPKTPRSHVICGDSWIFTDLPPALELTISRRSFADIGLFRPRLSSHLPRPSRISGLLGDRYPSTRG